MKNCIVIMAFVAFAFNTLNAQHQVVRELEPFENVKLDGNIRLYLSQADNPSIGIKSRKAWQAREYEIEVRKGTLYVSQRNNRNNRTPKITIYLKHTGISKLQADGFMKITTVDPLKGEALTIKGDGFIKGDLAVDVGLLKIKIDGFCTLALSGNADESDLSLDGFGKIKAQELTTSFVHKSAEGMASIRVGH